MIYCCSLPSGPRLHGASARSCFLCWPQAFKELRPRPLPSAPSPGLRDPSFSGPKTGAKLQLFPLRATLFASFFQKKFATFATRWMPARCMGGKKPPPPRKTVVSPEMDRGRRKRKQLIPTKKGRPTGRPFISTTGSTVLRRSGPPREPPERSSPQRQRH